ncbi:MULTISPECIES: hypothetical protein [unclassified Modestobacter]|uniref:hypothetical protein n=1 Tax=unclassified Modestobacter TaxID=2643866 RepID=UPI0022AB12F0|nr:MULTISPECIES: hypothetical protein [unclassified Modestobacter]MCZ2823342.1 hypothetical protein [Modestobacter sp. VKM Ac-2981]MCZ2851587.1 hypothetical protein [Modestobacter sp. VKM Ac-2982]
MASKDLRCRLGLHAHVSAHPVEEQVRGPAQKVCRRCGKRAGSPTEDVPPPFLG